MMIFKLLEQASLRWHKLAGSNIIPMVLAGAIFENGELKRLLDKYTGYVFIHNI